jgi:hypothetical protein
VRVVIHHQRWLVRCARLRPNSGELSHCALKANEGRGWMGSIADLSKVKVHIPCNTTN